MQHLTWNRPPKHPWSDPQDRNYTAACFSLQGVQRPKTAQLTSRSLAAPYQGTLSERPIRAINKYLLHREPCQPEVRVVAVAEPGIESEKGRSHFPRLAPPHPHPPWQFRIDLLDNHANEMTDRWMVIFLVR